MRMTLENADAKDQSVKGEEGFASRIDEDKKGHWKDLEGQGFKAHWDYFWSYYHIHVIIITAVIVFVFALVRDIVSQKPYAINAICINAADYVDALPSISIFDDSTSERFAEYAGIDTDEYSVSIDTNVNFSKDGLTSMDMTVSEKIFAQVASQDLDAMAADFDIFRSYARSQMFADLREVLEPSELEAFEEKGLVWYIDMAEVTAFDEYSKTGTDEPFEWKEADAPEMTDPVPSGLWIKKPAADDGALCGVIVNTKRVETAVDFLRFLVIE